MDANPAGWVIDGNYERKLDRLVTNAADVVVWLDLPLLLLLSRLWRRTSQRIEWSRHPARRQRTGYIPRTTTTHRGTLWGFRSGTGIRRVVGAASGDYSN
jgi:hypothetical protein